jgi:hypothetical protein
MTFRILPPILLIGEPNMAMFLLPPVAVVMIFAISLGSSHSCYLTNATTLVSRHPSAFSQLVSTCVLGPGWMWTKIISIPFAVPSNDFFSKLTMKFESGYLRKNSLSKESWIAANSLILGLNKGVKYTRGHVTCLYKSLWSLFLEKLNLW